MIAKTLMQELWRIEVTWDESIFIELCTMWKDYELKLQSFGDVKIARRVISCYNIQKVEIYGFSDASQSIRCVYLR